MKNKKFLLLILLFKFCTTICMEEPPEYVMKKKELPFFEWESVDEFISFIECFLSGNFELYKKQMICFKSTFCADDKYYRCLPEVSGLLNSIELNGLLLLSDKPFLKKLDSLIYENEFNPLTAFRIMKTPDDLINFQYLRFVCTRNDVLMQNLKKAINDENVTTIENCCNCLKKFPCLSFLEFFKSIAGKEGKARIKALLFN